MLHCRDSFLLLHATFLLPALCLSGAAHRSWSCFFCSSAGSSPSSTAFSASHLPREEDEEQPVVVVMMAAIRCMTH